MMQIILLNKPFNVLSQFSDDNDRSTLKDLLPEYPGFYAAGRLDYDSEGLLLLTNNGQLQHRISDPMHKLPKTYWVQVEGNITNEALGALCHGVMLNDGKTKPAQAKMIEPPEIWDRTPPIRKRKNIPTSWISLTIHEGRNRQVRRMTASTGFPTLRLVRVSIGDWNIDGLLPGEHRLITLNDNDFPAKEISVTPPTGIQKKQFPRNNNAGKKPASGTRKPAFTRKPR